MHLQWQVSLADVNWDLISQWVQSLDAQIFPGDETNTHWFHEATILMRILYKRDNLPGGAVGSNNRDYYPSTPWLSTSQLYLPHSPHKVNHHYTTCVDWPMWTLLNMSHLNSRTVHSRASAPPDNMKKGHDNPPYHLTNHGRASTWGDQSPNLSLCT